MRYISSVNVKWFVRVCKWSLAPAQSHLWTVGTFSMGDICHRWSAYVHHLIHLILQTKCWSAYSYKYYSPTLNSILNFFCTHIVTLGLCVSHSPSPENLWRVFLFFYLQLICINSRWHEYPHCPHKYPHVLNNWKLQCIWYLEPSPCKQATYLGS